MDVLQKGDEEMITLVEFLGIASVAVLLLVVLMWAMERAVQRASGGRFHRGVRIAACLGGALLIIGLSAYGIGQLLILKAALIGGIAILLNRYWLGHFSDK
ncbi:hypothetical protein [Bhargavaea beijingensis]|uniref:Uncharacterized protein n=1 Tax=Bhargavaea beijingensis TaxID=426756 RepID=A0A1G7A342_9BACL|nr:hypothetical protein [Bhargavaea beijingensis]MCW1927275.1 hypothetical protein [Bhargavaea beijingensis]RSK35596.1 hypothetical protein EJA12_03215 [Bhargavaea beijingensis]SDE09358.1 hypothetical protein SAMN04488126_103176 [Bhargavaea beijingensis]